MAPPGLHDIDLLRSLGPSRRVGELRMAAWTPHEREGRLAGSAMSFEALCAEQSSHRGRYAVAAPLQSVKSRRCEWRGRR